MSDEKDKIKITIPEYSGEEFASDATPSNESAAPVEELKKAEKILTDNDEIAAFNKEVLGELDPPLVVHKKSDTSYDNNNNSVLEMNDTHIDDTKPTLTRHRFKKENKKNGKAAVAVIFIAVIIVAVFAALYFTGNVSLSGSKKNNSQSSSQTSESTTSLQQKYAGTIVVKGMYIFVDGTEVDGIQGLTEALKYIDKSTTAYEIIIEGTQNSYESSYYNSDILSCLTELGFYGDDTKVEHVDSTGLMSEEEIEKSSVQASSEQAAQSQSQSQSQTQSQQQTQNAQ